MDWPRTLVARGAEKLALGHLRFRDMERVSARLHCVLLDCSSSMVTTGALARAKGVLLDLFREAYLRREHVALICFGGEGVQLRLAPCKAGAWSDDWIAPIGGGGGTPLAEALGRADDLLAAHGGGGTQGWLWLLSDARTRELPRRPVHADAIRVLDFESGRVRLKRARMLAEAWDVPCIPCND
ncbi:vWA domain-containing protein [Diaphorobacter caeni]|uniref:vWA domain-containing protein n=1 Tax=Diaphorobacter caeni TaxID=2784387 RepID=UPI002B2778AD|nr:magnesium chelatase [Diaphorobacter caeni]